MNIQIFKVDGATETHSVDSKRDLHNLMHPLCNSIGHINIREGGSLIYDRLAFDRKRRFLNLNTELSELTVEPLWGHVLRCDDIEEYYALPMSAPNQQSPINNTDKVVDIIRRFYHGTLVNDAWLVHEIAHWCEYAEVNFEDVQIGMVGSTPSGVITFSLTWQDGEKVESTVFVVSPSDTPVGVGIASVEK